MDFAITTFCNLKCKNCCALMSYYKEPFHYSLDEIKKSLKTLSDCDKVKNIQIIGGEPLLHPDINEIIKYVATLDFDIISIYTNCTVIPDSFEEALQTMDERFTICLTEYSRSTMFTELVELCEQYDVKYEINTFGNIPGASEGKEWLKSGNTDIKPFPKVDQSTCGQVMSCMGNKVYKCQRFGHLDQILDINLDDEEWCYVEDIDKYYEKLKEVRFTKTCNRCLRGTSLCKNIPKGS